MLLKRITDARLSQYAYLIGCQETGEAIIVDPERDIDRYVRAAEEEGLAIAAVLETHIHADFLSGAREFAERGGILVYLSGEGGDEWCYEWARSGTRDVRLLHGGDAFEIGNVRFDVLHTPGHTPEHLSVLVTAGGSDGPMGILTGDFVFVGDLGRPDLLESAAGEHGMMEPSARRLYESARRFLELPEHLQIWPGHGSGSACGKALGAVPQSTVGYERANSVALRAARGDCDAFVLSILDDQTEPPLYFGRAKRLNRTGPDVLGGLPEVRHLTVSELEAIAGSVQLVDARKDRSAFMHRHAIGAQFAPFDRTFPTTVGSLVEDADTRLVLVIEGDDVEEAVRSLIRIGFDNVEGYIQPPEMESYLEGGPRTGSIDTIDFQRAAKLRDGGLQVVDVRYRWEYEQGHLPGAIHAPYTRLPEYLGELPRGKPLIVHCAAGIRSGPSASFLSRRGWDVYYVNDVFEDWARQPSAQVAT